MRRPVEDDHGDVLRRDAPRLRVRRHVLRDGASRATTLAAPEPAAVTCRSRRNAATRRSTRKPWHPTCSSGPRHATAVTVPWRHRNAGPMCCARLTSVIAANGQLSEDWPSGGQIHRRVAMYTRSLQGRPFGRVREPAAIPCCQLICQLIRIPADSGITWRRKMCSAWRK